VAQRFGRWDNQVVMHFDDIGSRIASPDCYPDPAANTTMFIGGSYTMGHGLSFEDSMAGQVAAWKSSSGQVVNLGVQGYGTDQALLRMEQHFAHFKTQAVVYTFISDHIERNSNFDRRSLQRHAKVLGGKPEFALKRNGSLRLHKDPVPADQLSSFRLAQFGGLMWDRFGPSPGIELTRALIWRMREFVESRGARFILVHWSTKGEDQERCASLFHGLERNLISTELGAPTDWHSWIIPGDGHPDRRAHARVAEMICERLGEVVASASLD
jgi:hypothetical protein